MTDYPPEMPSSIPLSDFDLLEIEEEEPQVVLIVDDAPINLKVLAEILMPEGYKVLLATDGPTALDIARKMKPQVIILDIMMPDMDGFEVCRRLKEDEATREAAVIFCSALDDTAAIVEGFHVGAVDFITKPFNQDEVTARVGTHLAVQQLTLSLNRSNYALRRELDLALANQKEAIERLEWALLGQSGTMRSVQSAIAQFAATGQTVLLHGAPSCGEEAVARAIHSASARGKNAFVLADCSQQHTGLFDAGDPQSKLRLADRGTLLMEQLQLLSDQGQNDLLAYLNRVDEAKTAGERPRPDVRIIASSTLEAGIFPESFHLALKQVLSRHVLRLPQLMERREDILPIAENLLQRRARRMGKTATSFSDETKNGLAGHLWPGNLRELEDVIIRSLTLSRTAEVTIDPVFLESGIPLGSYRLLEQIGEGGMGQVWRAKHQLLARPAAIKIVKKDQLEDPTTIERFQREAKATSNLASPHTITLFDFGLSDDGTFYYVMELLDGIDLKQLLLRFGPQPPERVAHFMVHACKSLAESHAAGLIHRDIKPANLFTCRLGEEVDILKVLDFGLVRGALGSGQKQLTQTNIIAGTPQHISPEAVKSPAAIDSLTDIYSLGSTAYYLLTGEPPFSEEDTLQLVLKKMNEKPKPVGDLVTVPKPFEKLVMRCLAKKRNKRPSAVELWQELERSGLPQLWGFERAEAWWNEHLPRKK
jgi:DNA-binding NtrC family response regulator